MSQNQGNNNNTDVLQHSSGIRNQPGGSTQGGTGPYQRTPANYAGGPGMNPNSTITLHAQNGQTKQTTTDSNGAISDADRQWLADNGGAMPISQVPAQDKALVGTGTGAAAQMSGDTNQVGTKPLDNRPPGSYNPNTNSAGGTGNNNQGGNNNSAGGTGNNKQGGNNNQGGNNSSAGGTGNNKQGGNDNEDVLQHSNGVRNQPGGSTQGGNGPYQRTPANYAGGPGPNANSTITLHAQNGQTKQTTTDDNGAISDADRQWLADNGGAMPISQIPAQDKALVGTGTGAAAQMGGDANQVGTKPLDNRPPGSYNPNTGTVGRQ